MEVFRYFFKHLFCSLLQQLHLYFSWLTLCPTDLRSCSFFFHLLNSILWTGTFLLIYLKVHWLFLLLVLINFYCCCLVAQSCLTLCDPMNCSTPGFPVFYSLLEFAQTHVHWADDAIQPSHPCSSPSTLALNLSLIRIFSNELALHVR